MRLKKHLSLVAVFGLAALVLGACNFKKFNGNYDHLESKALTTFETIFKEKGGYNLIVRNCQHFS